MKAPAFAALLAIRISNLRREHPARVEFEFLRRNKMDGRFLVAAYRSFVGPNSASARSELSRVLLPCPHLAAVFPGPVPGRAPYVGVVEVKGEERRVGPHRNVGALFRAFIFAAVGEESALEALEKLSQLRGSFVLKTTSEPPRRGLLLRAGGASFVFTGDRKAQVSKAVAFALTALPLPHVSFDFFEHREKRGAKS
jgi:hypothetical protein